MKCFHGQRHCETQSKVSCPRTRQQPLLRFGQKTFDSISLKQLRHSQDCQQSISLLKQLLFVYNIYLNRHSFIVCYEVCLTPSRPSHTLNQVRTSFWSDSKRVKPNEHKIRVCQGKRVCGKGYCTFILIPG